MRTTGQATRKIIYRFDNTFVVPHLSVVFVVYHKMGPNWTPISHSDLSNSPPCVQQTVTRVVFYGNIPKLKQKSSRKVYLVQNVTYRASNTPFLREHLKKWFAIIVWPSWYGVTLDIIFNFELQVLDDLPCFGAQEWLIAPCLVP